MKVQVIMYVDRELAILKNKDQYGEVELQVDLGDLTEEERKELLTLETKKCGQQFMAYNGRPDRKQWGVNIAEANIQSLKELLKSHKAWRIENEERIAQEDREKDEYNREIIAHWISRPDKWQMHDGLVIRPKWKLLYNEHPWQTRQKYSNEVAGFAEAIEDADALEFWIALDEGIGTSIEEKRRQIERETEAIMQRKRDQEAMLQQLRDEEDARAARKAEKKEHIRRWVEEKGSESQKERMAENMLPDEEIVRAIRNDIFAPLSGETQYTEIPLKNLCDCKRPERFMTLSEDVKDVATEQEFATYKRIRDLMPQADVKINEHSVVCKECDQVYRNTYILVTMPLGSFKLRQKYTIAGDEG